MSRYARKEYPISPGQKKAIKMAQRFFGVSDDDHHKMLKDRFGVLSTTDLTFTQAGQLITENDAKGFKLISKKQARQHPRPSGPKGSASAKGTAGRPAVPRDGNVIAMVRPEEIDKVNAIARLILWKYANGLMLFLAKRMGIKDGKIKTSGEAYKAIEGLKKLFEHQMETRHGKDWWTKRYGNSEIMTYIAEHCPAEYR